MTIKVGHKGSKRRTQSTMVSKATSTRGTGKGQKPLSGTHDQFVKDFVAEAGVTSAAASVCWHLNQAFKLLQRGFSRHESREIDAAFNRVYSVLPPLDEESQGVGNEQAT
jgi:hypothetical protein